MDRKLIILLAVLFSIPARAATGDVTAVSIGVNGWDAYVTISGFTDLGTPAMGIGANNDPTNAKIVFTVTSAGYDTSGNLGTITRTVYGTKIVRIPYPVVWPSATVEALNNTVSDGTHVQKVIACAGTCTTGGSAPSWNASLGGTTVDNSGANQVTWKDMGALPADGGPPTGPALDENISSGTSVVIRVAMSEYIYASDTATVTIASGFYLDGGSTPNNSVSSLSVTNSSNTLAYAKPIGRWGVVGFQLVSAAFPLEFIVAHRFAQNSSEVAAVIFTCTDAHSHSNSVTVSSMTKSALASTYGDQNTVLAYAATMPITGFTGNDQLTCQAVAYPWVGDSTAVLNTAVGSDGSAQPSELLGPIYDVYDAGSYGASYIKVDATNGQTSCGTNASNVQATAEAALGVTTTNLAASCLKTYNNSNYSRNEAGNGHLLLVTGSYTGFTGTATALGQNNVWIVVQPATSATVTFTGSGGSKAIDSDGLALTQVTGTTISGSISNAFVGVSTGTTESLWLHANTISTTGSPFYRYRGAMYATNNNATGYTDCFLSFSTLKSGYALFRGNICNAKKPTAQMYAVIGNSGVAPKFVETGDASGNAVSDGSIVAFNTILGQTASTYKYGATSTLTKGYAMVQNVWEITSTGTGPYSDYGDTAAANANGIILQHETYTGATSSFTNGRTNFAYNNSGTGAWLYLNWSIKYNNFAQTNIKTDTFPTQNVVRVGNWAQDYGVGLAANLRQSVIFDGDFLGLGTQGALTPLYVNDLSNTSGGGGNYNIKVGSASVNVASFLTVSDEVLPYDLNGVARTGSPTAGAYMGPSTSRFITIVR